MFRSALVDTGMFYANEARCMLGLPVERRRLAGECVPHVRSYLA